MQAEAWRAVVGFEGLYEVSSLGQIRSLPRRVPCRGGMRTSPAKTLKPTKTNHGYAEVALCRNGSPAVRYVHAIVLEAFVGPRPLGMQGCHFNGDKQDNRLENLRWDSRKANFADSRRLGEISRGSAHPTSKLKEADIPDIRKLCAAGLSQRTIADKYGVTQSAISAIARGRAWAHLPEAEVTP